MGHTTKPARPFARLGSAGVPPLEPHEDKREVETIIFDLERQEQVAFLKAAVWPPVGAVIELGPPNRDAVVIGVRMMLPAVAGMLAAIVVDVNVGEPDDFIPRDPSTRLLSE